MTPHPSLVRKCIIRDAQAGRVRRTATGVDVHDRAGTITPVKVNATELETAGWLHLHSDGHWRPTPIGAAIAGIATRATR